MGVLVFDGLMVERDPRNDDEATRAALRSCERAVQEQLGWRIRLSCCQVVKLGYHDDVKFLLWCCHAVNMCCRDVTLLWNYR